MSLVDEVAEQLAEELGERAHSLAKLVGPDAAMELPSAMELVAPVLAAQLVQDEDDRLAAQTVIDVMCALWPHGSPETVGRADWWRTPLGRVCARSLGRDDAEAVTHSVAAAMLGVPRGSIGPMISRGHLDRHPDGGVLRASVLQRLADRR